MTTALIFGANGQDGYYLYQLCKERGIEAVGISRTGEWTRGDISQFSAVETLIKTHQPTYIFHVAANSTTRHEALFENHETISTGTLNVLEAAKRHAPKARVFITGSGLQFLNNGNPIAETDEFEANSAYSAARIQSVYAARYYRSLGLKTYIGYLFHHESPRRKTHHISKLIALSAARIAKGNQETLELGDITVEKEWTFAGDIAQGIFTLTSQEIVFEACIGSGITYTIRDWLEACFSSIGKKWEEYIKPIEGFKPEYKRLVSNPASMERLGWKTIVDLPELAMMMMKDARQIVG